MPYASCHLQCSAAGSARASRDRPYSLAIGGAAPAERSERCTTRGRAAHRVPFTTTVAASTVASVVASVLSVSRSLPHRQPRLSHALRDVNSYALLASRVYLLLCDRVIVARSSPEQSV